jgi:hypothetical protein
MFAIWVRTWYNSREHIYFTNFSFLWTLFIFNEGKLKRCEQVFYNHRITPTCRWQVHSLVVDSSSNSGVTTHQVECVLKSHTPILIWSDPAFGKRRCHSDLLNQCNSVETRELVHFKLCIFMWFVHMHIYMCDNNVEPLNKWCSITG